MDSVRYKEGYDIQDVETCQSHNRLCYCYCTVCYCLICPTCLMFDAHKGHPVCRIEEGAKTLRSQISDGSKEGLLKFEKTENVLLDIRHAKLTVEENRDKLIKEAYSTFYQLISALKARKIKFIQYLVDHFGSQLNQIIEYYYNWIRRQQICQYILQIQKSSDELKVIQNGRMIVNSLEYFKKPLKQISLKLVNGLNTSLHVGNSWINHVDFLKAIESYIQLGGEVINQFRA